MPVYELHGNKVDDDGATFFYRRGGNKVDYRMSDLTLEDACYLEQIIRGIKDRIVSEGINGGAA